jgi:hypothetical protein
MEHGGMQGDTIACAIVTRKKRSENTADEDDETFEARIVDDRRRGPKKVGIEIEMAVDETVHVIEARAEIHGV